MTGSTSRLTVDLGALAANYRRLTAVAAPSRTAGVLKADAYGLGLHQVARALQAAGCTDYFVATAAEGVQLRLAVPNGRIFVFAGPMPDDLALYVDHALVPVMNRPDQLLMWQHHRHRPIAVQVDTGMNRLGFSADLAHETLAGFQLCLLVTHLACADEPENPLNDVQIARFDSVRARFPGVRTSIGNSAGTLLGAAYRGDVCRPGIALYGGNPFIDDFRSFHAEIARCGMVNALSQALVKLTSGISASCINRRNEFRIPASSSTRQTVSLLVIFLMSLQVGQRGISRRAADCF
jgi:alanine racemase